MIQEVNEEVKKVNKLDENKAVNQTTSGVVIMTGVAKKKSEQKRKGELIEQNQDGLEVNINIFLIPSSLRIGRSVRYLLSSRSTHPKRKRKI